MANEVLSQDEIDALMGGVESGAVKTGDEVPPGDGAARAYDLASQERIIRGRMPTLDTINQRFARLFRTSIVNLLRRTPEVSVGAVKHVKFADYVQGLFVPASFNLVRVAPLRGTALVVLDPRLVFGLVNHFFGGDNRFHSKIEGREFTATEQRIVQKVLGHVFSDLKEAWAAVMALDFEWLGAEVNPQFANFVSPTEVVVTTSFKIEIEGHGGELHVTFPYSMIEPIHEVLATGAATERTKSDARWTQAIRQEIEDAPVELSSTLVETPLTLAELLKLKPGDVIPVELPQKVTLRAANVPVFRGVYGVSRGNISIKITEPYARMTTPSAASH
jgi:flagellar motor switch protein FliM